MDYRGAISYLECFRSRGIRLGLGRVRTLLSAIGDPQNRFRSIHIAGTNGKGSVAAMLSSVLTAAGYRTGLYTSPHLVDYTERVRVNEKDISGRKFASAVLRVKKAVSGLRSIRFTEFEVLTAASFLMLAEAKVDIAVIETGLGGRFDATNVISPIASVITNIGMDHVDLLGSDLSSIAMEKGGIIKPGVPLVTGEKRSAKYLENICRIRGSKFYLSKRHKGFHSPLAGDHQKENMDVALSVIDVINKLGYPVENKDIIKGLKMTKWPGRLETLSRKPLVMIDGAHNVPGANALAAHLKKFRKKFNIIIGMQSNKDIGGFVKILKPLAKKFIVVRSSNPMASEESIISKFTGRSSVRAGNIREALRIALGCSDPVCVTGSLYLVGDALRSLRRKRLTYNP